MTDSRVIVFDRDSPYLSMFGQGQLVECTIIRISERYIIADPIRESEPLEGVDEPRSETELREKAKPSKIDKSRLLENLRAISEGCSQISF
jgi:hypothetical protein